MPVMVWIYGGSFVFGSSEYINYAPDRLIEKGVVFVSFNYRLGVFGFLRYYSLMKIQSKKFTSPEKKNVWQLTTSRQNIL